MEATLQREALGGGCSRQRRRLTVLATVVVCVVSMQAALSGCGSDCESPPPEAGLDQALEALVAQPDGPPGVLVVLARGGAIEVHRAGTADLVTQVPIEVDDYMRLGSVAKAFSGAAALALVTEGALSLDDDIGRWRPDLPASWASVTLRQLLGHTSGINDFSQTKGFQDAVAASPDRAPPPRQLLSYVEDEPPAFTPGSRYRYSNSDNIVVGLIIEAATGASYETVLLTHVYDPLELADTSLPVRRGDAHSAAARLRRDVRTARGHLRARRLRGTRLRLYVVPSVPRNASRGQVPGAPREKGGQ